MDIFDKMCFTVSSAGGRRGAQMGTFDVGHPDAMEFIRAKRENGRLRIEVRDDGLGGANPNGHGLDGLHKRLAALDGTLAIASPVGGPTVLYAEVPCAS
jgi:ribonucleotide reductase alpha subunit